MSKPVSFAGRAVLALVLMIGFYLLAVGIAALLLWIPYAEVVYAHRLHIKLAVICVISALVILWSIVPRIDKFVAPGPQLDPARQPRLFHAIQGISQATGQSMPAEVYLVNDVNAWVTERGGWMGFGSRRVMGIGLPLMQMLNVSEFRGVLAHEFGHYHGGDTKLGPWVYKTRGAIMRTLAGLGDSLVQKPFIWYGNLFLRLTHAISRAQEFAADVLAAGIVGSRPMRTGLQTVHSAGPAFDAFWRGEAVPVLSAGYRPPLADGFRRFLQEQNIATAVANSLVEAMKENKSDPYDTHPALGERIAALEQLPPGPTAPDEQPAITLLNDVAELEQQLLVSLAGAAEASKLQPVAWETTGAEVFLPQWRELAKKQAAALAGITPDSLPERVKQLAAFAKPLLPPEAADAPPADHAAIAGHVVGTALAVWLYDHETPMRCVPGSAVSFLRGAVEVQPFNVVTALEQGKLTAAEWQTRCAEFGLTGLDLGQATGPA
jgi:heat shock protein HtpX